MCGINGCNWVDRGLMVEMNASIKHRGPDGDGIFTGNRLSLGHTRLSIIDLSDHGHQPMTNEDESLWIVYNGEIYNYEKLKKELKTKGHAFRSRTDTEVILRSFAEEGTQSFSKLNGIFAFCIYDKNRDCLYLVRDRIGVKPLYYFFDGKRFVFSSEIKAFKKMPDTKFSLDENAVLEYFLTMNISAESFFTNIRSVEPGHYLKFELDTGTLSTHKYFDVYRTVSRERYLSNQEKSEKNLIDELDSLLHRVVRDQLMADVPVGSICSGGIDSSLLTAIAKQYSKNLKIFNVSVIDKKFNESPYARRVAKHLALDLIEEELSQSRFIDYYARCIAMEDLPLIHVNSVGLHLISQRAKQEGISVLLSGDGADELFGGYPKYKFFYARMLFDQISLYPYLLKRLRVFLLEKNLSRFLTEDGDALIRRYDALPWIRNRSRAYDEFLKMFDFLRSVPEKETVSYMLKDLKYYLMPSLIRTDRMSMAAELEMRVPFLDNQIVDFAVNLPLQYKVGFFKTKYLLKKVAERYLPKDIVYRKKIGFLLPVENWLNAPDIPKIMFDEWKKINCVDHALTYAIGGI